MLVTVVVKLSVLVLLISSWCDAAARQPTVITCDDVVQQTTSTCVSQVDGTRSCCPIRDGVCCPNADYCCPRGFECDASNNRCVRDKMSIPFYLKLSPFKDEYITCPDNKRQCKKSSQSCCQLADNSYGCCPMSEAVCCDDKVHCCPKNYACNIEKGKCDLLNGLGELVSFSWKEKVINDVVCPGGKSECPSETTCCQLNDGSYGCCPIIDAVCCDDHEHCCPHGYTCDVKDGRCNKGEISLPFLRKFAAKQINIKRVEDVVCPGGQDQCPSGSTCCQLDDGSYGCCPYDNAACCDDHEHCCPNGYTCDVKDGQCKKGDISLPFVRKTASTKVKSVVCPGGQDECPNGSTCCQLNDGDYGCCPIENAVCCTDHVHCCPGGYTCDVKDGRCNKGDVSIPFLSKFGAKKVNKQSLVVGDVVCPGGQDQCPNGSTCCQLDDGSYGCCPIPNAVCCTDHEHCCPSGYTCDVQDGRCNKGKISLPFLRKFPAKKVQSKVEDVVCPNQQDQCPSGSTCCQLDDGSYGCCPIENAVCCSDHEHCCPSGYTCDVQDGRCNKGEVSIPFVRKFPAKKVQSKVDDVVCPGGQDECPSGSTCCQLDDGSYGCCPIPNAVCCTDHQHCCPSGYTCDVQDGRCNKGKESLPFLRKFNAKKRVVEATDSVVCPDGKDQCSPGSTCCQLGDGNFGCCPLVDAVCCSDHLHCCPKDYKCDMEGGRCSRGFISIPFYSKTPATPRVEQVEKTENSKPETGSVVCPDRCSFCPNGFTCCQLNDESYGCCPLPNAVCCTDHLHCCPAKSVCDLQSQSCDSTDSLGRVIKTAWSEKVPAKLLYKQEKTLTATDPVLCGDNSTSCGPLKTCCKMENNGYGCCNYVEGVCCSWGCCPKGKTCGKNFGECFNENKLHKIELKAEKMIHDSASILATASACSLSSSCTNTTTCCDKPDGSYACCPYANGICCGSHGFCCPDGYSCADPKLEACVLNDDISVKEHVVEPIKTRQARVKTVKTKRIVTLLSLNGRRDDDDVACPNDEFNFCEKGHTCCKANANSDSVGCCPSEGATCCSDGVNCCPSGFRCAKLSSSGGLTCRKITE